MNDYEELMQAAEPLRRYLEAHCGLTTEILVSRDRVDVLRCEFGIPFSRTIPDEEDGAVEVWATYIRRRPRLIRIKK